MHYVALHYIALYTYTHVFYSCTDFRDLWEVQVKSGGSVMLALGLLNDEGEALLIIGRVTRVPHVVNW